MICRRAAWAALIFCSSRLRIGQWQRATDIASKVDNALTSGAPAVEVVALTARVGIPSFKIAVVREPRKPYH